MEKKKGFTKYFVYFPVSLTFRRGNMISSGLWAIKGSGMSPLQAEAVGNPRSMNQPLVP